MPRIRTLKPEMWADEAVGAVPIGARLLYVGLITQADDAGRFSTAPVLLKSSLFPYDESVFPKEITGWLADLDAAGLVALYTVRGKSYGVFPNWEKHQRIDNAGKPLYPSQKEADPEPQPAVFAASLRDSPRTAAGVGTGTGTGTGEGKDQGGTFGTLSSRNSTTGFDEVWNTYARYHPRAKLTTDRRRLIQRRLREWPSETLVAAIHGNHASPHCNGQNKDGREYHNLDLILRNAEKIEAYAGITTDGRPAKAANGPERALQLAREAYEQEQAQEAPYAS